MEPSPTTYSDEHVTQALSESQRLGFLGDRPIPDVIEHARRYVPPLTEVTGCVADIGAGGGVPGLVVALDRPDLRFELIDRRAKRTDHLRRVVRRLGWNDRIRVVESDVDDVDREFDAVIARGFGPPDVTLRCAVRILRPGGRIVISEPPTGDRWDTVVLEELGLQRSPIEWPGVVVFTTGSS